MADQWFFARNDQQTGPMSMEQLKLAAANGQLQATDLVWKAGLATWVPASKITGLMPTTIPPSSAPARPPAPPPVRVPQLSSSPGLPQPPAAPLTNSTLALVGFILGVCGLLASCVPILGFAVGTTGLVFSILGVNSNRRELAITGIVLNPIVLLLSFVMAIAWISVSNN